MNADKFLAQIRRRHRMHQYPAHAFTASILPLICSLSLGILADTEIPDTYEDVVVRNARLSIVLCNRIYTDAGFRVETPGSTAGNPDSIIETQLVEKLPKYVKKYSTCSSVQYDRLAPGQKLFAACLDSDDFEGVLFAVPRKGSMVKLDRGQSADFILFIYNASIVASGGLEFKKSTFLFNTVSLQFRATFTLWDVKKGTVAAYGTVRDSEKLDREAFSTQEITDIADVTGGDLIEESCLGKK